LPAKNGYCEPQKGTKGRFICHLYTKMFKNLSFMIQNNAFLVVSADTKTCGSPLSATSVAIIIIPNLAGMFNEK
jgi:hypothetical protein